MKLLLINPSQPGRGGFSEHLSAVFPPLGLGVVASLTEKSQTGWEIILADGNFGEFETQDADLVAFTSFTSTIPEAIRIAKLYKDGGTPTVIGGAHASAAPEELLEYFDAVVVGEAEPVWGTVLDDFVAGKMSGIYSAAPTVMVSPDRSLFDSRYPTDTIQTTRGCPRACEYCSVSKVFGKKYRSRDMTETLVDIDSLTKDFFIIDDNFVGFGKTRRSQVLEICQHLVERGNKKFWHCQTEIDISKHPEVLSAMYEAGCRMLFIGIETEDGTSMLYDTKKRDMTCKEAMTVIHEHKMSVLGSFILGLETDTKEDMRRRVKFIHECGVDSYQMSMLTPLPGTKLFERLKDKLFYGDFPADWRHYDFVDTVFIPESFKDSDEFREEALRCFQELYNNASIEDHIRKTFQDTGDLMSTGYADKTLRTYRGIGISRLREEVREAGQQILKEIP